MATIGIAPVPETDEQAISAVAAAYCGAWNRHDMNAIAELFCEDAHWVNIVGWHWAGKPAVVAGHEGIHRTIFRETAIAMIQLDVRRISADVAIGIVTLQVGPFTPPDGVRRPASEDRLSLVLRRAQAGWHIAHGHNTVIDPLAKGFNPLLNKDGPHDHQ
jgi:uncharacterized protein (TIGR02246 family)